jgi:hypothetical protein
MAAPEVKDITFDRPDYTSGAFIVFVGQNTEVAPPGPFWARKAFNKQLTAAGVAPAGSFQLWMPYTVPTGKVLFITDAILINAGTAISGEPRYPVTGYWYAPSVPQVFIDAFVRKTVGATDVFLDWIVLHPNQPSYHKVYQTPLTVYAGETLKVSVKTRLGSGYIWVVLMGYETAP